MATSVKPAPEPRLEYPSAGWIALKCHIGDEFSFLSSHLCLSAIALLTSGCFPAADCKVSHRSSSLLFAS